MQNCMQKKLFFCWNVERNIDSTWMKEIWIFFCRYYTCMRFCMNLFLQIFFVKNILKSMVS